MQRTSLRIGSWAILAASISMLPVVPARADGGPVKRADPVPPAAPPAPAVLAAFDEELAALRRGTMSQFDAGRQAMVHNPSVKRSAAEVAQRVAEAKQTELVRIPRIGATLGYTRLSDITPPVLGGGFSFPVYLNSYGAQAQIAVPISDYVIRFPALLAAVRQGTSAARAQARAAQVISAALAVEAYWEWVRARVQVLVAERTLAQVDATLGQIQALFDAQRRSRADLLRVQSERSQAAQGVDQLRSLVLIREAQLREAMGVDGTFPLSIGEDIQADLPTLDLPSVDDLVVLATTQRADVCTLDAGIAARVQQERAEQAGQLPQLDLVGQLDFANPNQRFQPADGELHGTWAVGLRLSWTLNEALRIKYSAQSIHAQGEQLEADRERLLSSLRLEVMASVQSVLTSDRAIATTGQGREAAEESYRVRQELFAADRATSIEVIDAEADLARARLAAVSARIDQRVARAHLAHAIGKDVEIFTGVVGCDGIPASGLSAPAPESATERANK